MDPRTQGLLYALAAYLSWGFLPLYFKALSHVSPLVILSHRVVWSVVLLGGIVWASGRGAALRIALGPGKRALLAASTTLIATNWLVYIWAVHTGRILEASLGYFLNPLVNVLLGVAFLGETLGTRQRVAVALAGAGVLALVVDRGTLPWISVVLAVSFGFYGLLRKRAGVDPMAGLLGETALLVPLALVYLAARSSAGEAAFGPTTGTAVLLVSAGAITALPLVWFTFGVQRLRLSTMGLVQYLAPTCQFLLAVVVYREPFGRANAVAFGFIWASLALYSWDALARARAEAPRVAPATALGEARPPGR